MEYFTNKAEAFYREIRKAEIYAAETVSYLDNFNGVFPAAENALYVFDVIPETFSRKIPTKKKNGNYFFDADMGFPLLDLKKYNVDKLFSELNKQGFAVVLVSNVQKTIVGNDRFPLTVEIIDNIKDDNSGDDEYAISITGETLIHPKIKDLL